MTNNKITVLFVFHESQSSGGATYSGINMIKSLDRTKIQGCKSNFRANGYTMHICSC